MENDWIHWRWRAVALITGTFRGTHFALISELLWRQWLEAILRSSTEAFEKRMLAD